MRSNATRLALALSLALALPIAVPAFAQSHAPFLAKAPTGTLSGAKFVGVPVIGMDHVRVGEIEDLLIDGSGQIRAVVIGVGGFLGVGEKSVAVPFEEFAWNTGDVSLTSGPSSVVKVDSAPSQAAADKATPDTMPGSQTTREVLGAVQNQHSDRVTDATGSVEAARPSKHPATVLAGDKIVHAEVRLTKAQLQDAPAFSLKGN
ncbi:PRC-barrel domain-containing protein [Methylorubrum salsuginis]|uniref:PRC-barrel domain-containing protein n=1 Tax=Methylorubrum salsuginis TaxID=414703 RepID=A0A1I4FNK9_9HYPH|nr:PRC-barrel domain-containing protein [Methylorubrum salsuginis]SFL19153.1 PRC-barrel domain-containing protein [Methylorubrum salsuginis]